ncbi:MBL fold metallo-hydrolase [Alteromonas sp. ASW11-19]|uniref:MBL fold metallo-hydrolase n=1 Tax=Alteromonas salexigens TaxID=2982530 RepID=A0ABT2VNE5_9ALTE|nr:MBL fold metallo-hydrolase [Alteromonas salexigens]MCU7554779.1 MBL fold metallo-hydrolase [Alteromonas salexigens]
MKIHTLQGYIQFIFLVEDGDKLLLLDGCSRADVDAVCEYIQITLGRPLSDLALIVVTHMHPDHAGGAHALRARTGAPIAAHPKARKWYSGVAGRSAHAIDVALTWWVASRLRKPKKHIWYSPVLKPDQLLTDGQTLPGFSDWQVVFTPGHTDHDLSLIHTPSRQAYVADLIVQVKGQLVPPYPVCHPNQYKRSLQRMAEAKLETLFCAHVPPLPVTDISFDDVLAQAPTLPKNHWHSTKNRLARKLGFSTTRH